MFYKIFRTIVIVTLGTVPHFVFATTTNYIYPLGSWRVTTHQGEEIGTGYYHMGIDAGGELPAGTPVYAVADGIVREAKVRSQFGLVVLIEHAPDGEDKNVSLYGHLSPSNVKVSPDQVIHAGDIVGVLGNTNENGGWGVHLHFGIHKSSYTGEWVYYGHVRDAATSERWHDPEIYIPQHLVSDVWKPTVDWNMVDQQLVGNVVLSPLIGDIGSGVKNVRYFISPDSGKNWTLLKKTTEPFNVTSFSLANVPDGPVQLQTKVKDNFNNTTVSTQSIFKDTAHFNKPLFVTIKTVNPSADITERSTGNAVLNTLAKPLSSRRKSGDIALADTLFVAGRGKAKKPAMIRVFNSAGEKQSSFMAFSEGSVHVASGDVDGDGESDIIAGSHSLTESPTVKAFHTDGALLWQTQPFGTDVQAELDVAAGDVSGDSAVEIIVGARLTLAILSHDGQKVITTFKPFGETYTGGLNVATGDLNNDGKAEIIVGTRGSQSATVRVFDGSAKQLGKDLRPFGDTFTGEVDVASVQWDTTADARELLISQANSGESYVKVYRFDDEYTKLFNQPVYSDEYTQGVRIVGWQ